MRVSCFTSLTGFLGMVVLAGGAVASGGCSAAPSDARTQAQASRPAPLSVYRGRFSPRFLLTGELEAVAAENLIVPPNPNWQTTIRWIEAEGSTVKADQKVVEFDTAAFASDYGEKVVLRGQAQSELEQAEADGAGRLADKEFQVAQKSIDVEKARIAAAVPAEFLRGRDWQNNQVLLARAESDLEKSKEDLESEKRSSREAVVQARIGLDKVQREVDAALQALNGMVLKAPREGILVVGEHPWEGRKLQVGDSVWVGLSVASLPDLAKMRVVAKLSDVDDGRVVPGMAVDCTLDAFPGRTYGGKVTEVMPVAQEDGRRSLRRVYTVKIDLDATNPAQMRPGMSVKVNVRGEGLEQTLLAPRDGLDFSGAAPRARLASGKTVEVKLGPCDEGACVVLSGLAEGDRLRSAV